MSFFEKLAEIATGGLAKEIFGAVKDYFPPDMPPEKVAQLELAAKNLELQKSREFSEAQANAERALNERIAMYEGSASDLKAVPYIGSLMLLVRGAQRPLWGFATMWIDFQVFNGSWKLTDPLIANAFWVVNFLVLGFLFGERAVTNIMPFVTNMIQTKKGN